jgi:hypothetical protein
MSLISKMAITASFRVPINILMVPGVNAINHKMLFSEGKGFKGFLQNERLLQKGKSECVG